MKYLHTMVRVSDLDASLAFYKLLGLEELKRQDSEKGRFTLVFLAAPGDESAQVELTHNWDPEEYSGGRNFGHLAYAVDDIYDDLRAAAGGRGDDQPAAARRAYGVRPLARRHLGRAAPGRRAQGAGGAMGVDAEHRGLVRWRSSRSPS